MNTPQNNDWSKFCPPYDLQFSLANRIDSFACVDESFSHIVYALTGFPPSVRALAKQSGVTPQGSDTFMALSAVNSKGLIPYQVYPNPTTFTWAEYYQDVPQEALQWQTPAMASLVPFDLSKSPGWTRLMFPNGMAHFVMQINDHQYFDSEPGGAIKNLNYGGAVVTSQMGVQVSDNFFLKSAGFTKPQFDNLSEEVRNAIVMNDNGAKNIIIGDKIIVQNI